jgi:class 3 adenylate cyclase
VFWQVIANTVTRNMRGSHWPFSPDLAAALAAEGRVSALSAWTAEVERVSRIDMNPHNLAALALVKGHQLSVAGSPADAVDSLQEAERRYGALPAPARQVEALLALTQVRAHLGDLDGATRAVDSAESIARRLDARTLLDQTQAVRAAAISRPVLATLLFTDIVGATESAASLGDRAWRDRLERHHGIVRRELARAGGREIDTAGDGFLVAFDSPAAGVRCAVSVQRALHEAGIAIRAGLHTGECQESGGKLAGLTVHIAARVSQLARPAEVLVSSTVKELVTGSAIAFVEAGTHELKGVPGQWRLYAVGR